MISNKELKSSKTKSLQASSIIFAGLIMTALLIFNIEAGAQNRSRTKKQMTAGKKQTTGSEKDRMSYDPANPEFNSEFFDLLNNCFPQKDDPVTIIEINKELTLKVTAQAKEEPKIIADGEPVSSLNKVLLKTDGKSAMRIRFNPDLSFDAAAKILTGIRQQTEVCINIEDSTKSGDNYIYIFYYLPEIKADPKASLRPNPLFLQVEIKPDKKIILNNKDQGSVDDLSQLEKRLAGVFKDRENNGVFRVGRNEVEKTVFVKSAPLIKLGDLIRVAEAVRNGGAQPVVLRIND